MQKQRLCIIDLARLTLVAEQDTWHRRTSLTTACAWSPATCRLTQRRQHLAVQKLHQVLQIADKRLGQVLVATQRIKRREVPGTRPDIHAGRFKVRLQRGQQIDQLAT